MKFSIIIPVYNVEQYVRKCLQSIENQTFQNFEVIIINDGTLDNSQAIIDEFVTRYPEQFQTYQIPNGGPSKARNYGIKKAKGDYLIFVDADDYIDKDLLASLYQKIQINSNLEMIKIPCKRVNEKEKILEIEKIVSQDLLGEDLLIYLRNKKICIDPVWAYCIKRQYWQENHFVFPEGKLHEDFAIILIAMLKAKKTTILSYPYYYYVIRENSIMTNTSYENAYKKANDKLAHYDNIVKTLENMEYVSKQAKETCLEYVATAACMGMKSLKGKDRKEYQKQIRERKVLENIKCNTIRNMLRKVVFMIMVYG